MVDAMQWCCWWMCIHGRCYAMLGAGVGWYNVLCLWSHGRCYAIVMLVDVYMWSMLRPCLGCCGMNTCCPVWLLVQLALAVYTFSSWWTWTSVWPNLDTWLSNKQQILRKRLGAAPLVKSFKMTTATSPSWPGTMFLFNEVTAHASTKLRRFIFHHPAYVLQPLCLHNLFSNLRIGPL